MSESRKFAIVGRSSGVGRSSVDIECPFCRCVTRAYIWSLYGSGKRCHGNGCDAMFHPMRGAFIAPRKKAKKMADHAPRTGCKIGPGSKK